MKNSSDNTAKIEFVVYKLTTTMITISYRQIAIKTQQNWRADAAWMTNFQGLMLPPID